ARQAGLGRRGLLHPAGGGARRADRRRGPRDAFAGRLHRRDVAARPGRAALGVDRGDDRLSRRVHVLLGVQAVRAGAPRDRLGDAEGPREARPRGRAAPRPRRLTRAGGAWSLIDSTAVDPFAAIMLGGVALLVIALVLLGRFYPGSGS